MNDLEINGFVSTCFISVVNMKIEPANDAGSAGSTVTARVVHEEEIDRLKAKILQLEAHVSELDHLAHLDPLVELPNRRRIFHDLERVIAHLDQHGGPAAVIFVDVDGLKHINDQFGHAVGDAALVRIAQTLVAAVRKTDIVARLSGDEFLILLPKVDELGAWNTALRVAEATAASPLRTNDEQVALSVAVGVTTIRAGDKPNDVISRADRAMYQIKST